MGVTEEHGRFRARVSKDGKRINLGSFASKAQAQRALNRFNDKNREQILYVPDSERGKDYIKPVVPKKPSLMSRIKARLSIWQKKLHEL